MIVGVHQPNYLPYLGFFDKMRESDIFIIYDDAQFNKGDFQHRNRIRIHHGSKWLTVPVEKKHVPINEIRILNNAMVKNENWNNHHLSQIVDNYKKSACFADYFDGLSGIYQGEHKYLAELNMELIAFLNRSFDIYTKISYSSEAPSSFFSTQRLIELVQSVNGDTYLSGSAGRNYLDIDMFEACGIEVIFQDFKHPVYEQQYEGFVANMSAIDALFNGYRFD
ncbi:WbqC family protein [Methanolobus halotolerans]|uniref:WbqC-like protein family protein n=1 Tax=Methanolobus halotolerans TaxID=2052935 RepID=A0A4E0PYY0_9EURY|nr:WbqC family protein [Methanolobus halotolerans]TGC11562.1 hypothetical protein CUN85_01465 [Methanolobus halotolerans]